MVRWGGTQRIKPQLWAPAANCQLSEVSNDRGVWQGVPTRGFDAHITHGWATVARLSRGGRARGGEGTVLVHVLINE
jgi:hypothetical protein